MTLFHADIRELFNFCLWIKKCKTNNKKFCLANVLFYNQTMKFYLQKI